MIRQAGAAAAVLVAAGLGYLYLYDSPRRAIREDYSAAVSANNKLRSDVKDRRQVEDALKEIAGTTLGSRIGEVDTKFRGALNEIAAQCGLKGVQVDSRQPAGEANPAAKARFTTPSGLKNELRKQRDFEVIAGSVEGKGTLEQVLRTVATVQAQPWVHRVDSFTIKPEGKDRSTFALKLGVATLFMPDLAPKTAVEPSVKLVDLPAPAMAVLSKNMFREPARVETAAAPPVKPVDSGPAPPPPPPYADWKLTGVVESRMGVEAWVMNTRSGERRTLSAGAAVVDATFVAGQGERAVFEIGGKRFEVQNGQTLDQRRPTEQ